MMRLRIRQLSPLAGRGETTLRFQASPPKRPKPTFSILSCIALLGSFSSSHAQDDVAAFYRGRQIRIVVGSFPSVFVSPLRFQLPVYGVLEPNTNPDHQSRSESRTLASNAREGARSLSFAISDNALSISA